MQTETIHWNPMQDGEPVVTGELYLISTRSMRPQVAYLREDRRWQQATSNRRICRANITAWAILPKGYKEAPHD